MSQRGWDRLIWILLFIGFLSVALNVIVRANAQGMQPIPPRNPHMHDDVAGKFYESWNKPNIRGPRGERIQSCCNKMDCAPVEIIIKDGRTYVRGHFMSPNRDVHFPDYLHEHNQDDARESPDGRNHACLNSTGPLCLVLGIGS